MSATVVVGQQWVGLFSQSPNSSVLTSTGSTNNTSEVFIKIPGFFVKQTTVSGKPFKYPEIPRGIPIMSKGDPDLQSLTFTLQLPAQGDMEVSVVSAEFKDFPDYDIPPSVGNLINDGNVVRPVKGGIYETDTFYPGHLFDSHPPFTLRNTRNQVFEVYPFQYNPTKHTLRFYYNLRLKITNIGGEGVHPLSDSDLKIRPIKGLGVSVLNNQFNTTRTCSHETDHGSMLVICPKEFLGAIAPLVQWRAQTGIVTKVLVSNQFRDSLEIKSAIKAHYLQDSTLAYLLLVGDSRQVPTNMVESVASDNYYSYLSGSHLDKSHYPDIMVGRFSAESVKDVETQVKRTLDYELNPSSNEQWLSTATGIGSETVLDGKYQIDFVHIRNLIDTLESSTYIYSNEFYDGSQGLGDANGNPSPSAIATKINQGTGVIFYAGHGSSNGWTTGTFTKSVVEGLNNNGKYPIIWSASCETGSFVNNYCFAESWLRATNDNGRPAGAVAALMASGSQYTVPPLAAQHHIANLLSHPQQGLSTLGSITISGLIGMNKEFNETGTKTTDSWILFGDPALNVRTTKPEKLIVSHKGSINLGIEGYKIECNASEGFACISKDGEILGTSNIADGKATLKLNKPLVGDSLTLTITSFNYLPYIAEIKINLLPDAIASPQPINHSELQPINRTFSWEKGEGESPDYYLFSLGTDNPPANLINSKRIAETKFDPEFNFKYGTTYYWKVSPVNPNGFSEGKVLDFTTIGEPDEDFENGFKSHTSFLDGGTAKWEMDSANFFDGKQALRSGQIQNNESSSLIYTCDVRNCDFVSFWCRTSSLFGDKLQFCIDSVVMGEWTGDINWNFQVFQVNPGFHKLEWRYTKDGSSVAGNDAVWIDDIHMPKHLLPTVELTNNLSVCEGASFETAATAKNQTSVIWETNGDGVFDDINLANTTYKPGVLDQLYGHPQLLMHVYGFNACPVLANSMSLNINPLPAISLPSDTMISSGYSIVLDASVGGGALYQWSCGNNSASIVIDTTGSVKGVKSTNVTVTNSFGCSASKEITLHFNSSNNADIFNIFPNPSNGDFTLQPEKGFAVVSSLKLLNMDGKVLWDNTEGFILLGERRITILGLPAGVYLFATYTPNGVSTNQIYIR